MTNFREYLVPSAQKSLENSYYFPLILEDEILKTGEILRYGHQYVAQYKIQVNIL